MSYNDLQKTALVGELSIERKKYDAILKEKISLDMSRGKPASEQLDIGLALLDAVSSETKLQRGNIDLRNYGCLEGIPEMRKLMADLMDKNENQVIIGGNSSLNLMFDTVVRAMLFGIDGNTPWSKLPKVKFLCPVPGYDRHFTICEKLGIEMIAVPTTKDGPVMEIVENLVLSDPAVKGMFCVPRFANPTGIVYSDEVVDRIAQMKTAASDFLIIWDNAYYLHDLYENAPKLKNLLAASKLCGTQNRVWEFFSTSKITLAGAGIAAMASSEENVQKCLKLLNIQTIGYNKLNQLAHLNYLKSKENTLEIMKKQAEIIRPKFEAVISAFEQELTGIAEWTKPMGGYFICLTVANGTAKRVVELAQKAGLKITPAGATHPLHQDDLDNTLRIAPTYPSVSELTDACRVLVVCVKIALLEQLTAE